MQYYFKVGGDQSWHLVVAIIATGGTSSSATKSWNVTSSGLQQILIINIFRFFFFLLLEDS